MLSALCCWLLTAVADGAELRSRSCLTKRLGLFAACEKQRVKMSCVKVCVCACGCGRSVERALAPDVCIHIHAW